MSTRYVITFIIILTSVVAVALTGFRQVTKNKADLNEEIFNKRSILQAVEAEFPEGTKVGGFTEDQILEIFDKQVEQVVLNMAGEVQTGKKAEDVDLATEKKKPEGDRLLPLYIFNQDGKKYYILSVRGRGLWDEIWGNIALASDLNTVVGATFDHKGETPGLGAETKDNPAFAAQFEGKQIYQDGKLVSIKVRKGGAQDEQHEVDAITGATITSEGVTEMLKKGIKFYEPYFNSIRSKQ